MEEFKVKRHAVKKMTRKGLVETDSREGIVKETAEAKSDGRRIDIRRYTAEVEILRLYHFRSYCYPFNGIRKTLIGHQLTKIKHRQDTVESCFRINITCQVATHASFSLFLSHLCEIANYETVQGKGSFLRLYDKEIV